MHWRNSNFQKLFFIICAKHTVDDAYRVALELREERQLAVDVAIANRKKTLAKRKRLERIINNPDSDELDVIEAEADLEEMDAHQKNGQACFDEAVREIEFLNKAIDVMEPHRKYAHLPSHEAFQLAQTEEWARELLFRAENSLLTIGSIDTENLKNIRLHPQGTTRLLPAIRELSQLIQSGNAHLLKDRQHSEVNTVLEHTMKEYKLLPKLEDDE